MERCRTGRLGLSMTVITSVGDKTGAGTGHGENSPGAAMGRWRGRGASTSLSMTGVGVATLIDDLAFCRVQTVLGIMVFLLNEAPHGLHFGFDFLG